MDEQRTRTSDSLLTIAETASELRISERHLFRLMSRGEIRRVKIGSRTLITYRELLRVIAQLEAAR
ncbi:MULTISPECIES: helix-turn-helix domain-containing protein [Mycolicibacterium]|uniref:helix-turn-helix domain-containing protein n=1 Tax=Mycolicibacterium TaxID=1866885 RepID=UPI0007EAB811|nr:helix-turn-helix domain-containing protein [Mycolicibacterium fortuitum]OBG09409.1 hypothetical protein A5768_15380 [Mycolicibacterium fortuitum]